MNTEIKKFIFSYITTIGLVVLDLVIYAKTKKDALEELNEGTHIAFMFLSK